MTRNLLLLAVLLASATAHAATATAAQRLQHAQALARAQHKSVFVDFSPSWCPSCQRLDRFFADPHISAVLAKAFIVERLTVGELPNNRTNPDTPGADDLRHKLSGQNPSYPYIAILSDHGEKLADSIRGDTGANFGYPGSPSDVDWFMQMLRDATTRLTPADRAAIESWLRNPKN